MMQSNLQPVRLTVTQALIDEYAILSEDFNPIHVDPEFAAAAPTGGIIAHGTLSLNLIWQSLEETFEHRPGDVIISEVRFKEPVRINDELVAGGAAKDENVFQVWVRNQTGSNVIEGVAQLRRGAAKSKDI
jgi:3-hydroxybutyryl-CoA dehydratase